MEGERELRLEYQASRYFTEQRRSTTGGTREQYNVPYVISGGEVTEHYYFKHISATTKYKLNVEPEYFGGESQYEKIFPQRINRVFDALPDAKIYCVFDLDVPSGMLGNPNLDIEQKKYNQFRLEIQQLGQSGQVVLAYNKPSFEYWLLLHFKPFNETRQTQCSAINGMLGKTTLKGQFPRDKSIGRCLKSAKILEEHKWVQHLCSNGKLDHAIVEAKKSVVGLDYANALQHSDNFSAVYKIFEDYLQEHKP